MDQLEKFITENTEKNQFEPFEGHLDRFVLKLEQSTKKKKIFFYQKLAAVAIVLMAIGSIFIQYNGRSADVPEQYKEIQMFYTAAINTSISKIELLNHNNSNNKQINDILRELKKFDQETNSLLKNFDNAPNDERILNSMILHYKSHLNTLEKIIIELESLEAQNFNTYEKVDI